MKKSPTGPIFYSLNYCHSLIKYKYMRVHIDSYPLTHSLSHPHRPQPQEYSVITEYRVPTPQVTHSLSTESLTHCLLSHSLIVYRVTHSLSTESLTHCLPSTYPTYSNRHTQYTLTHSLTHSFTYTQPEAYSLTHSLTHLPAYRQKRTLDVHLRNTPHN